VSINVRVRRRRRKGGRVAIDDCFVFNCAGNTKGRRVAGPSHLGVPAPGYLREKTWKPQ
jgi:hypothetical protein